jgi:hypothetical protein
MMNLEAVEASTSGLFYGGAWKDSEERLSISFSAPTRKKAGWLSGNFLDLYSGNTPYE